MSARLEEQDSQTLKYFAAERLAIGVIPFEQWVNVFANPNFLPWPGLRAKAFTVWFPTMIDYLSGSDELAAVQHELARRSEHAGDLFERAATLATHYRALLSLYAEDEQIFIRDRRLQNVHGRLHIYARDEHDIRIFDRTSQKVTKVSRRAAEYRDIMMRYYPTLRQATVELIERLLRSKEFSRVSEYYREKLEVGSKLSPLMNALGVGAAAGSD